MSRTRRAVLVIDDQEDERAIQRAFLAHLGYEVREAADGLAGLQGARAAPPDLVVLDISLPHLDGFAVCRALRAGPATAEVPVLFFTASPVADLEAQIREVGGNGVLVKPVDPHEVAEEIRRLIGPPGG